MTRRRFYTLDVFTDRMWGGNPLAVIPDAEGLSAAQMQGAAREFNLSETVFVFPPADPRHARRLRIFTPGAELPFAGHPTIGAAYLLAALGELPLAGEETRFVLEEGVGPVPVTVRGSAGAPAFVQLSAARLPELGPEPPPRSGVAAALSLADADLGRAAWEAAGVSCGVPFLFVPVRDLDALGRARVERAAWERHLARWWSPNVFLFTPHAGPGGAVVRARMFAPGMGIEEDPATGSAAVALAGYLALRDGRPDGTLRWTVEQGVEMGRPSVLHIEADMRGGSVTDVRVGGAAVLVSEGTVTLPGDPT